MEMSPSANSDWWMVTIFLFVAFLFWTWQVGAKLKSPYIHKFWDWIRDIFWMLLAGYSIVSRCYEYLA